MFSYCSETDEEIEEIVKKYNKNYKLEIENDIIFLIPNY